MWIWPRRKPHTLRSEEGSTEIVLQADPEFAKTAGIHAETEKADKTPSKNENADPENPWSQNLLPQNLPPRTPRAHLHLRTHRPLSHLKKNYILKDFKNRQDRITHHIRNWTLTILWNLWVIPFDRVKQTLPASTMKDYTARTKALIEDMRARDNFISAFVNHAATIRNIREAKHQDA
jgi:hypothetical protein